MNLLHRCWKEAFEDSIVRKFALPMRKLPLEGDFKLNFDACVKGSSRWERAGDILRVGYNRLQNET